MKKTFNNNSGFVAFTSLIIISAVVLSMAVSASLIGVDSLQNSLATIYGEEVAAGASGCAEEILLRLRRDDSITSLNMTLGEVSCTMNIAVNGANKDITITASKTTPVTYSRDYLLTIRQTKTNIVVRNFEEI